MNNNWYKVKEDFKYLCYDLLSLIIDLIYELLDRITPEYISYKLLLHKTKKHMWTKEYLINWERIMQKLVDQNKLKQKHKDKIMEVARYNSEIGYQKYSWCMKCNKRNTNECNKKVCYKNIDGDKPKLFRSMTIN